MNLYKKLLKNSVIFAIANLGSKLLSILLVPFYTYFLSTNEYGAIDMVITSISLILPIITLSIFDATLRFSVKSNFDYKSIFSSSFIVVIFGNIVFILFYPLLKNIEVLRDTVNLFYIILILQSINSLFAQFSRGIGKVKQFALNGLINTIVTVVLNIILLAKFSMGIRGYFISIIIAYIVCNLYLIKSLMIWKYFSINNIQFKLIKEMTLYSIPVIPNSLMWWIMNSVDRYTIIALLGVSSNGIYAIANKIPTVLNILYSIFSQAWQLSAIEEAENDQKSKFYTDVFNVFSTIMLLGTSFILVFIKIIVQFFLEDSYQEVWRYVPFLLLSVVFTSFSSFLGTNYIAMKETKGLLKTSFLGAFINILLNILLIPKIGLNGASISTMISFLAVWIVRIYDTRHFVNIDFNLKQIFFSLIFIFIQIIVIYSNVSYYMIITIILFIFILSINKNEISKVLSKICNLNLKK